MDTTEQSTTSTKSAVVTVAVTGLVVLAGLVALRVNWGTHVPSTPTGADNPDLVWAFSKMLFTWMIVGVAAYAVYHAGIAAVMADGWRDKLREASKPFGIGAAYCGAVGWFFYGGGFELLFDTGL